MTQFNPGAFLSRQLEQLLPRIYEKKYPTLWAEQGMYFPAVGDLEMGAQTIIEEAIEEYGEASIYAGGTTDIPIAEVDITENSYKAVAIVMAASYGYFEMERASKAGKNISILKMNAVDRMIRQRIHKLACFGSSNHSMEGFFNLTGVSIVDSSYDADNAATTSQDHIDFIKAQLSKVEDDTNLVHRVSTIMVPPALLHEWQGSVVDGGDSVVKYVLDNFGPASGGGLTQIIAVNEAKDSELEAYGVKAAATGDDRLIFAASDPDIVERHFYAMGTRPPQERDLNYRVCMYAGTSEPVLHYAGGLLYVDIPTVT